MKDSLGIFFGTLGCMFFTWLMTTAFYKDKLEHEYERGVIIGRKMGEMKGVDSVDINTMELAIWKGEIKNKKVQSITFKADSIVILNFDSTEIK